MDKRQLEFITLILESMPGGQNLWNDPKKLLSFQSFFVYNPYFLSQFHGDLKLFESAKYLPCR